LKANERIQTRFRKLYVTPRERHDDFADQTDDVGIGATRHLSARCSLTSARLHVSQAGILYVKT
jgi:hypothetical protein